MDQQKSGSGTASQKIDLNPKNLIVLSQIQPAAKRVYRLHKDQLVIGSIVSSDVQITGDGVSPIHAVIEVSPDGKALIYDLASATGVFVNGVKGVTTPLKTGDEITIGRTKLKFSMEDPASHSAGRRVQEAGDGQKLIISDDEDLASLLLEEGANREEIFDYRPAAKTALETVMSWSDSILNVEHFVDRQSITVGSDVGNDFTIPPFFPSGSHPIASMHQGGLYAITLDPQMKGVVQRQGQVFGLDQVRAMLASQPLILGKNEFAKISLDGIDFYFSYTSAPPKLKQQKWFERDPFFFKIAGTSLGLTLGLVLLMLRLDPPQPIDVEQLPERLATIVYEPEKFMPKPKAEPKAPVVPEKKDPPKPEPEKTIKLDLTPSKDVPKDIPKTMQVAEQKNSGPKSRKQDEAKEGAGARAKGKEGQRGSPNANAGKTPQDAAKRTSPQGGVGAGGGNSQVQDQGNVDLLKGAASTVQNILGNTAAKLGSGGSELKGFGNFATLGKGGQALSGSGKGGGGDAEGLGGLADKGRGGGRVGTGLGAAGNGTGIIGGSSRVALRQGGGEEAVVMGSIDKSAIEAAIMAHKDEFRLCYEREINAENPNVSGMVRPSFTIGASGRVTESGIQESTIRNANVERCVLTVLKRIQFPVPVGGVVQVTYPFRFEKIK